MVASSNQASVGLSVCYCVFLSLLVSPVPSLCFSFSRPVEVKVASMVTAHSVYATMSHFIRSCWWLWFACVPVHVCVCVLQNLRHTHPHPHTSFFYTARNVESLFQLHYIKRYEGGIQRCFSDADSVTVITLHSQQTTKAAICWICYRVNMKRCHNHQLLNWLVLKVSINIIIHKNICEYWKHIYLFKKHKIILSSFESVCITRKLYTVRCYKKKKFNVCFYLLETAIWGFTFQKPQTMP